jgi:hypothetical protein
VFESTFESTLNMITGDFNSYPEHRLKFFALLHAITQARAGGGEAAGCVWRAGSHPAGRCLLSPRCAPHPTPLDAHADAHGPHPQPHPHPLPPKTQHCFSCMLSMTGPQIKLIIDSIVWAFRHTERNVAEEGLSLLLVRPARARAARTSRLAGATRLGRRRAASRLPPHRGNTPHPVPVSPPPPGPAGELLQEPRPRDALLQGLLPAAAARGAGPGGV